MDRRSILQAAIHPLPAEAFPKAKVVATSLENRANHAASSGETLETVTVWIVKRIERKQRETRWRTQVGGCCSRPEAVAAGIAEETIVP